MLKKILKHTLRTLLVVLLVLLLVPALLYVPAVQDLVRRRAVAYASRTLGMEVSVERIRLAFPLRLTVDNTLLADRTDTLLRCGRLSLDAALWPLIRKEVVIRSFALERVAAHYKDTLAGMDLRLAAGELSLEAVRADLSANTAGISRLVLADADIRLNLTEAAPAEKKESAAALPWTVGLDRIAVSNLAFGMRTSPAVSELSVRLADGSVDTCRVLLDSQQVSVKSVLLDRGAYSYLTGPTEAESGTSAGTTEASAPWTVRVGRVALTGNSVEYGRLGHRPAAGFDPAFIALAPLDLTIDSVYNRGADIALQIRRTAFTERCGLSVRDLTGRFGMDASGIVLSGLDLQTAFSRIRAELTAGAGILKLEPASPLDAVLSADLNTKDLKYLSPEAVPPVLDDRTVRLSFSAAGTLGNLGKTQLEISSPGHLDLKADAAAKNLLDANRMEASARFEGDFRDLAFLKALLPDTAPAAARGDSGPDPAPRLRRGGQGDVLDGFDTLGRRRRTFREGAVQPPRTELRRRDPGRQLPAQQFPPGRFAGDRRPDPAGPRHGLRPAAAPDPDELPGTDRPRGVRRPRFPGASNSTQNSTASAFRDESPTATKRSGCCCSSPER